MGNPKVFISYSHDSPAHSERVRALAWTLRSNRIDVELDQFHDHEIVDWPRWCNEQTSAEHSDFVVCVCTHEYRRAIDGKVPPEKGKGVYWEGSLLDDDLYDEKGNRRLIAVLLDDEPEASIPRFLRGWTCCRIRECALSDSGYERLLRILTRKAKVEKNELGPSPALPTMTASAPVDRVAVFRRGPSRLFLGRNRGPKRLVGRDKELADLDAAWNEPDRKNIVTLFAWGGIGKTSLVARWASIQLEKSDKNGIQRYFEWSFYNQGTRREGAGPGASHAASGHPFLQEALKFFGDPALAARNVGAWQKGERLAELIAHHRTLLILDGLEPLQDKDGELWDDGLRALVRNLAANNPGLCLITTRQHLPELAQWQSATPEWKLARLTEEAGADLLTELGVRGPDLEKHELTTRVRGHALTLTLLGRYLNRFHNGEIRRVDCVDFQKVSEEEQGGHASRVIAAYERWFKENNCHAELAILRMLGVFDRPAAPDCIGKLRNPPVVGLTDIIATLSETEWEDATSRLVELDLVEKLPLEPSDIHRVNSEGQYSLDAHPLVRGYFASSLQMNERGSWEAAHERLRAFFLNALPKGQLPESRSEMVCLYRALEHGCCAGKFEESLENIYKQRIQDGDVRRSTEQFGLVSMDLAALERFFEDRWVKPVRNLGLDSQAYVLHMAGFQLWHLGRLEDARKALTEAIDVWISRGDLHWAARSARRLSEVLLFLGKLDKSKEMAERAREWIKAEELNYLHVLVMGALAHVHFQTERNEDRQQAKEFFAESEQMLEKLGRDKVGEVKHHLPYQYWHSELLLDAGLIEHVEERLSHLFVPSPETTQNQLIQGLKLLFQGMVSFSKWNPYSRSVPHDLVDLSNQGVGALRASAQLPHIVRGYLFRSKVRYFDGNPDGARSDLSEAQEIAERGPMRLCMADIHLYRARLFRDKAELEKARELITQCGYRRREQELEYAEEAAKSW